MSPAPSIQRLAGSFHDKKLQAVSPETRLPGLSCLMTWAGPSF